MARIGTRPIRKRQPWHNYGQPPHVPQVEISQPPTPGPTSTPEPEFGQVILPAGGGDPTGFGIIGPAPTSTQTQGEFQQGDPSKDRTELDPQQRYEQYKDFNKRQRFNKHDTRGTYRPPPAMWDEARDFSYTGQGMSPEQTQRMREIQQEFMRYSNPIGLLQELIQNIQGMFGSRYR